MYWRSRVRPELNQRRMKRRFAWWPKKLNDGYTIWLGFYVSSEVWDPHNLWTATDRYLDGHAGT